MAAAPPTSLVQDLVASNRVLARHGVLDGYGHVSAFVAEGIPVFDIREAAGAATDMLVRTPALARALAESVGAAPAALMRGHGVAVVGGSLAQVVGRCIYMEVNARIQLDALRLG